MASGVDKNVERRKRVFVGALPDDFLRVDVHSANNENVRSQSQQEAADAQTALALQQQLVGVPHTNSHVGRLTLSVIKAVLMKNYGLTRMDPYVRIRVGHSVYETHTDSNGGKTPKWNRDIQCLLPQGVTSMYVEIFDECSFSMDELIAWTHITIPPSVLNGETLEDWFTLSGKQGEGLEGSINMVLSYTPVNVTGSYGYYPTVTPMAPVITIPAGYGMSAFRPPHVAYTTPMVAMPPGGVPPNAPAPPQPNPQDISQMEEMFPNMDKEVIRSVYECSRYQKDVAVNSLLQMAE